MSRGTTIGIELGEHINRYRLNNFIAQALTDLRLPANQSVEVLSLVRFDNFFFQKRFLAVISGPHLYFKKYLDKKGPWIIFSPGEIRLRVVEATGWDQTAVQGCQKMLFLECTKYPKIFKGGRRWFAESDVGSMIVQYNLEKTEYLGEFLSKRS